MSQFSHQTPRCRQSEGSRREERGASLVEYALLVALIAVVCIAAVTFLGQSFGNQLGRASNAINGPKCPPGWVLVDQNNDGVLVCQPA